MCSGENDLKDPNEWTLLLAGGLEKPQALADIRPRARSERDWVENRSPCRLRFNI